eukprot:CAMPEP_0168589990 /NCGR_PEP_ID=MMETSP0420-20121227/6313_1 /TAXON_ID=498008 /ORGANISM="Pessonella sp." /LENGTH=196 /DNA_ID=CAMNT_0008625587 /DNA_START=111 /DNA_END=701 /DNA_ORIENTATION=-
MPEVNVVNTTPETTHVNTFFRLLRDQKSATKAIEAHNQLATVLVELKMLAPGSSLVHKGKVQKTVAAYEDQERDSFTHLIEIREKVLPKADEPFVFHAKKFRKSLIKPAVRMVDDELRGRWEAISKALHAEEMEVQEEADDIEVPEALTALFKRADDYRALIEKLELAFVQFRHRFIRAVDNDFASLRTQYHVKTK